MQLLKQSTAATTIVGPILDSTGANYTGAVIGDLNVTKNGTTAAMAAAATLTHDHNGYYLLLFTTGNTDTLGRLDISCNKSTYAMPIKELEVLAAAAFDTIVTNGTLASTTSGRTIVTDAAGLVDANVVKVGPTGSGTAQTARDIGASVLLSTGTGTGQLDFTSGVVKANATQLLGTAWLTPGTAGTPDVNVKLWNALTTVALPLVPTVAGRTLDVSATGEGGVDWANVGGQSTSVNLSATTVNLVNTATTVTNQLTAAAVATGVWTDTTAGDFTTALSVGKSVMNGVSLGTGLTVASVSGAVGSVTDAVGSVTGNVGGNVVGSVASVTARVTANTDQLAGQTVTAAAGVTFPSSVASPTNITAGTITTATNVTTVNGLAAGAITATSIAADAITAAKIADGAIDTATFATGTTIPRVTLADTLTTYTGNTVQTGDAYARLGAPAGASVSADVAAVQADLPQRFTKNVALSGFTFPMVLASDHVTGATGKTVTATRSIDGAAFAACTNSPAEVSSGFYKIDLSAADLNGNTVAFLFTAAACDPTRLTIVTEPT